MFNWKAAFTEYLRFSKMERAGVITLLALLALYIALPYCYSRLFPDPVYDHTDFKKQIAALSIKEQKAEKKFNRVNQDEDPDKSQKAHRTFAFDPNTISAAGWEELGLNERVIKTIGNYIQKGGKFRKPGDLKKIWGISEADAARLVPFVRIQERREEKFTEKREYAGKRNASSFYRQTPIDINIADTSEWIALPGIGSKLANRIVQFREKLGGFYRIEQVAETFGLHDSVFNKIRSRLVLTDKRVRQININSATIEEMKVHPYIRYSLANIIYQYRIQHGPYTTIEDIRKIMIITTEVYAKLAPYISVRS